MPEAYVLETLRTARTTASPRGGFAGILPVDLLAVAGGVESVSRVPMFSHRGPLFCDPAGLAPGDVDVDVFEFGCVVDERAAS